VTAIVLLHGWGMSSAIFDDLAERLAPRFSVRAIDLPGYGGSAPSEPYSLAQLADDIARLAPARCCVLGWSLGAQVALTWARAKPDQVEKLALIAATPCFTRRTDWDCAIEPAVLREFAAALQSDYGGTLVRFISLQARGDAEAKSVMRRLRAALDRAHAPSGSTLEAGLRLLLESDLRSLVSEIVQPALVVHGERDMLVPAAAGDYLASALRDARLVRVARAAHAPFISDAARVSSAIGAFCA
jgi:pimeloyl-[acyl-carrier protein] methyl ester esterase